MIEATRNDHHVLTISDVVVDQGEIVDYNTTLTCFPGGCEGWQECREGHKVEGYDEDANVGPYDCAEEAPWADKDEFVFHGVMHEWRYGWGWTVPFQGCVLAVNDFSDGAYDIMVAFGPGEYLIEDEWDDTEVWIYALSMADGSPLPEEGWLMGQPS